MTAIFQISRVRLFFRFTFGVIVVPPNLFHTTLHIPPYLFICKIHFSLYTCLVCHLSFPKINSFLLINFYELYKLYRLKSPPNIKSFHLGLIGLSNFQKSPSIQLCYQEYFKCHITHPSQHFFLIIIINFCIIYMTWQYHVANKW
jgi:hypothetical protein